MGNKKKFIKEGAIGAAVAIVSGYMIELGAKGFVIGMRMLKRNVDKIKDEILKEKGN